MRVLRVVPQFPYTLVMPIGIVVRIRGSLGGTVRIQQSQSQLKVLTGARPSRGATVPAYARGAKCIVVRMRDSQGGTVRNQQNRPQLKY